MQGAAFWSAGGLNSVLGTVGYQAVQRRGYECGAQHAAPVENCRGAKRLASCFSLFLHRFGIESILNFGC
jgi:hypothetical protein